LVKTIQGNLLPSDIRENSGLKYKTDSRAQTPYVLRAENWLAMVKSANNHDVELVLPSLKAFMLEPLGIAISLP